MTILHHSIPRRGHPPLQINVKPCFERCHFDNNSTFHTISRPSPFDSHLLGQPGAMQPSSDFRSRGPGSLASRRPRSSPSLLELTPSVPTSRLILAGLAITAARRWIESSQSIDTGGGEGWCVLGYWFWRVWIDTRSRWKKKGRRKDASLSLRGSVTTVSTWLRIVQCALLTGQEALGVGLVLAVQSITFFMTVGSYGPLR